MSSKITIPNPPPTPTCPCYGPGGNCVCGDDEIFLRGWVAGVLPPMTPPQREWCLDEIAQVEGFSRKDYEEATDEMLARGVLSAWTSYCRDKGLI